MAEPLSSRNISLKKSLFNKDFEIFLSLCETRSFRKTAQLAELSVASVSRILSELEASLGVPLFDRSRRPASLTAEGRRLESELRPCMRQFEKSVTEIRLMSRIRPSLRIGFIDSFSYDIAPAFIRKMAPSLQRISCLTGGADRLCERLSAREVDVILSINPCFEAPGLRRFELLTEPSVIIFPRSAAPAAFSPDSWRELAFCGLPFIHNYRSSGGGRLEDGHFQTHDISVCGNIYTDSIGMRMKLVAQGLGWAIIRPLSLLQHLELLEKLRVLPSPPPGLSRSIYVLAEASVPSELFTRIITELHGIIRDDILWRIAPLLPQGTAGIELRPLPKAPKD